MAMADNVKTNPDFPIPETQKAWVLGDPGELSLTEKPVPSPSTIISVCWLTCHTSRFWVKNRKTPFRWSKIFLCTSISVTA